MKYLNNKIFKLIAVFIVLLSVNTAKSQDGEALFKQNCAACHLLEGTLVGPQLKGVKPKWVEAGEEANLLLWVKNPSELYESGNSEMAKLAWDASPMQMTPLLHLSEDDIKSIFEYIEGGGATKKEENVEENEVVLSANRKPGDPLSERIYSAEEKAAVKKENNNRNRMIFIFLVITAMCLVFGIVSVSKTIQTFSILKMRKKDEENTDNKSNGGTIATIILALTMLTPFSGYSMSFNLDNGEWLVVANLDNILLFVGNVVLLLILLDQKKTLKTIIGNYDESIINKKQAVNEDKKETTETVINLLTDTVAIEDEASILMDHDYDGIKELDNNLPPWWVWSFAATVVAAFIYLIHFHVIKTGDLQIAEYEKDIAAEQLKVDEYMSAMAMNVDENNVVALTESSDIDNGKAIFKLNCVVCHKENGEGLVGPNLTDNNWLIGEGDIKSVFKIIKYGTTNGMPEHESKLNPIELQEVASYILTMEYTEGKAPEGKLIEK